MNPEQQITEGPPCYFVPICVQTPLGFIGGPSGYQEVGEAEKNRGPIIEKRKEPSHELRHGTRPRRAR